MVTIQLFSPCPGCGKNVPFPEGGVCTHCQLKKEGRSIRDYYLDLASIARGGTWKEYCEELANWEEKDSFTLSSADMVTPLLNEFSDANISPETTAKIAEEHNASWGFPSIVFCERTQSHYLVNGFTGGAFYRRIVL